MKRRRGQAGQGPTGRCWRPPGCTCLPSACAEWATHRSTSVPQAKRTGRVCDVLARQRTRLSAGGSGGRGGSGGGGGFLAAARATMLIFCSCSTAAKSALFALRKACRQAARCISVAGQWDAASAQTLERAPTRAFWRILARACAFAAVTLNVTTPSAACRRSGASAAAPLPPFSRPLETQRLTASERALALFPGRASATKRPTSQASRAASGLGATKRGTVAAWRSRAPGAPEKATRARPAWRGLACGGAQAELFG